MRQTYQKTDRVSVRQTYQKTDRVSERQRQKKTELACCAMTLLMSQYMTFLMSH